MSTEGRTVTVVNGEEASQNYEDSFVSRLFGIDMKLFLKLMGVLLVCYLMGYYEFSFAWMLGVLVLWLWRENNEMKKLDKKTFCQAIAFDEKKCLNQLSSYLNEGLPSWVYFPDVERVAWMNKIIGILWPYVGDYVQRYVQENLEPSLQEKISKIGFGPIKLDSFKFVNIVLGDRPFKINGIKVYDQADTLSRQEITMDMEISYSGDCNFKVSVSKFKAGVKDIQFHGTLRVVMKPLVNQIPLVGALQIFFLKPPAIDFDLTNAANFFDIPAIKAVLLKAVSEVVSSMMVLPNKFPIKLIPNVSDVLLHFPDPKGVLSIHLIEAKELEKKDGFLLNSDPYALINVGPQEFRSKTINNTTTPQWDFFCEPVVYDIHGQTIDLDVMDADSNTDDCLGRLSVDINAVAAKGSIDQWIPLQDAKSGLVHLKATWFSLCSDLQKYQGTSMKKDNASICILIAYADSAAQLPNAKKSGSEPSPYVRFIVDNNNFETKVCTETNTPAWNQGFCFLLSEPEHQNLSVEILDKKTEQPLGELVYPIRALMKENGLKIERPFHLKNSQSTIKLCLQLKIMVQERVQERVQDRIESTSDPGDQPTSDESPDPISAETASLKHLSAPPSFDEGVENNSKPFIKPLQLDQSEGTENTTRKRQVHHEPGTCKVRMALRYSIQKQTLHIVVFQAEDVPVSNHSDLPDAYVKLQLIPGSPKDNKRKTVIVKNSANPVYDEKKEYIINHDELYNQSLNVSVCSTSSALFGRRNVLGKTKIDFSSFNRDQFTGTGITQWFELKAANGDSGGLRQATQSIGSMLSFRRPNPKRRNVKTVKSSPA